MSEKEAKARIKINKLLEEAGWRFFDSPQGKANILLENNIISEFIYPFVTTDKFRITGKKIMTGTGGLQRLPAFYIEALEIPLPSLEVQKEIVEKIEAERKTVDACKELIKSYEAKIKKVIDKVWEE